MADAPTAKRVKSPSFQFYAADFLSDGNVAAMTLAETGAYIRLLALCWVDGSLPNDPQRLAQMVGTSSRDFLKLWGAIQPCFREQDGRLVQPRLEREREKQASFRQRASDRGTAGANGRWHKHASSNAQAPPKHASSITQAMRKHVSGNT